MKKILITITLVITLATSAFASDEKIKTEIVKAFTEKFKGATDIKWARNVNYCKATFNYNGIWMFAYYSHKAELITQGRNLSSSQLPFYLQNTLKNKYADYWITELFEHSDDEGFRYYVRVENADKIVILESANGSQWKEFE